MKTRLTLTMLAATLLAAAATQAPASAAPSRPAVIHAPSLTYASSAQWISAPYGSTLRIQPTWTARAIGVAAASGVWNNAFALAGWRPYSQAVYSSMFEQLQCHLQLAIKVPYNLDTWRPSVPYPVELAKLCNPV